MFRNSKEPKEAYQVKTLIEYIIKYQFGNIAVSEPIDVLDVKDNRAFIRVHANAYNLFNAALCLTHQYEGSMCSFQVINISHSPGSVIPPRFLSLSSFNSYSGK